MKLFDIKLPKTFMGEFEVTLNYPLHITDNIYIYFPKEYDAQIADCILEIFTR